MNAGIDSVNSLNGIFFIGSIISSPMPGARPNGSFPMNAMTIQPIMAASAVAVNTAPPGIGFSFIAPKMSGFTARIYDIVRNVVIPAMISVLIVVLVGSKPKSFLSITPYTRYLEIMYLRLTCRILCTRYEFVHGRY